MADPKIPLADLPYGLPGAFDRVAGVDTATGAAKQFPMPQAGEPKDYPTRANLPSAAGLPDGTAAHVNNDPNPDNNGRWAVFGGQWVQSADRVTGLEQNAIAWTHPSHPEAALSVEYFYIDTTNGNSVGSAGWKHSDYIRVMPSTAYRITARTAGVAGHAWYDENKVFIAGFGVGQRDAITVTSPANAAYTRLTQQIAGGPYPFAFRTDGADISIDRLRAIVEKHMPEVDAGFVMYGNRPVDAVLDSISQEILANTRSRGRLVETLKLASVESNYRRTFGARFVAVGDSTMRGTYNGDAAAGVDGSTLDAAGDSWFTHMCLASDQQVTRVANVGDIGATVQDLAANFSTHVIARDPDSVIISGGTNNAVLTPQTTPAEYRAIIESMITAAIESGITPVLASVLPSSNSTLYEIIPSYNAELMSLANEYGLYYIDLYNFALDPVTGGLKAEYSGDGVHPSGFGQAKMGEYAATLMAQRTLGDPPPLAVRGDNPANLIVNPLFAGPALASGNAPGWLVSGSLPAGATASLVTRTGVLGQLQRISAVGITANASLQQTLPAGSWSVGDEIEITGRVFSVGAARKGVYLNFVGNAGQRWAIRTEQDASGVFHLRQRIPAGTTNVAVLLMVNPGASNAPASGTLDVGQLMVRNLTAGGLT